MIVYRRTHDELPARAEEVHHAEEEGVLFDFLVAPLEVLGNEQGWVSGLRCQRMELGEPDDSGRRRPVPIEGSEFVIDCDMVVVAIGTRSNPILTASAPDLDVNQWGYIVDRRDRHDQPSRRLRRGRHRPRRGHGDPGHGRRQARGGVDPALAER